MPWMCPFMTWMDPNCLNKRLATIGKVKVLSYVCLTITNDSRMEWLPDFL